jgi:hypothetical protein
MKLWRDSLRLRFTKEAENTNRATKTARGNSFQQGQVF